MIRVKSESYDQRVIRVFISSTFKDMHKERELLVKHVFPELRRICVERFVTFTEIDLRWGITEEQAAEGKVLPICLKEIHRTRPYFVGLLGERYGWIPESFPQDVIEREPWLVEHIVGKTSVTELEILHGVLNNPEMADHSFFYFRDPSYVLTIPEKDRKDFIAEDSGSAKKLMDLKDRIRKSGFPVLEDYPDPNALADAIREQFLELIDRLYPKEEVPDRLDQEAMGHEAYGRGKLLAYVERPEYSAALDAFIEAPSTGQGLVLTGESGCGKTALLASWVKQWKEAHPDDFMLVHYFGATPESSSIPGFLHRLLGELKRNFSIQENIPTDPDKLREALPLWLAQTVGKGRIILVLDALNQIAGSEPERALGWLPRYFPEHVRVIASTTPGPALDALITCQWTECKIPLVDREERIKMILAFLGNYGRMLRLDLSARIADAPGSANPLFLRTVLEELRQFGSFEQLPTRVAYYLVARSPEELFQRVLRRWQEDFGSDLVRHSLSLLWAARQGLSESEWLELLGTGEQPLPRQAFTPLFLAMEPHLMQRGGLWAFGHDYLRQAVQVEFLPTVEECDQAHLELANYFERQEDMTPRKSAEWPWQLRAAESWERLEKCLTDQSLFLTLYNKKTEWELSNYWLMLRDRGVLLDKCYKEAFERWLKEGCSANEELYVSNEVGSFLVDNACFIAAEPFYRRTLEGRERMLGEDHPDTLASLHNLAALLACKGDYRSAETLYLRALEGQERMLGQNHPHFLNSMHNIANLLLDKGDYPLAENISRFTVGSREVVLGKDDPNTLDSVSTLGRSLAFEGDLDSAEPLCRRALESQERVLGKEHPTTLNSVSTLGILLLAKGDFDSAEPLCRRALEGLEQVLGKDHPATLASVNALGALLYRKGEFDSAEALFRRTLAARERVLGKNHPITLANVSFLSDLLYHKGDHNSAEPFCRRSLEGQEQVLGKDHPVTLARVCTLGALLYLKGDYKTSEALFRRSLEGQKLVLGQNHPNTLVSIHNLAVLLYVKREYESAKHLCRCALNDHDGKEHPETLNILNNLRALLNTMVYNEGTGPLGRHDLKPELLPTGNGYYECGKKFMADTALASSNMSNNLQKLELKAGNRLIAKRGILEQLETFRSNLEKYERLLNQDPLNQLAQHNLSITHENIGDLLLKIGDLSGALKAFKLSCEISSGLCLSSPKNNKLQFALSVIQVKVVSVLFAQRDFTGAREIALKYFPNNQTLLQVAQANGLLTRIRMRLATWPIRLVGTAIVTAFGYVAWTLPARLWPISILLIILALFVLLVFCTPFLMELVHSRRKLSKRIEATASNIWSKNM